MPKPDTIAEIEEHRVKTGETLQSLASAAGITWQELAKFNWGTDVPAQINERIRDEVGSTRKDARGNFIFDSADEPGIVLIPKKFEVDGLTTDTTHTLRVLPVALPKTLFECVCIPGVTFEFDKSFIRPSVAPHMEKLDAALKKFPDAKLMVYGHTDRVGGEEYNKILSERRAESAYAFVTDQPAIWEKLYNKENWGLGPIQEILTDLGFDPGPIDGKDGPQTQAAVKEYQASKGLTVDGKAGPATRKQLFLDYMTGKHDVKAEDSQFIHNKFMGCGEFNPVVPPNENELAKGGRGQPPGNEPNRRVVFYLFKHPPKEPPCKLRKVLPNGRELALLEPCNEEIEKNPGVRNNLLHKCDFYDRMAFKCRCEQPDFVGDSLVIKWVSRRFEGKGIALVLVIRDASGVEVRRCSLPSATLDEEDGDYKHELDLSDLKGDSPFTLEVLTGTRPVGPKVTIYPGKLRQAVRDGDSSALAEALLVDTSNVSPSSFGGGPS
jgi:outer membrane protein OmpA-like peptidoglycan-associated protein